MWGQTFSEPSWTWLECTYSLHIQVKPFIYLKYSHHLRPDSLDSQIQCAFEYRTPDYWKYLNNTMALAYPAFRFQMHDFLFTTWLPESCIQLMTWLPNHLKTRLVQSSSHFCIQHLNLNMNWLPCTSLGTLKKIDLIHLQLFYYIAIAVSLQPLQGWGKKFHMGIRWHMWDGISHKSISQFKPVNNLPSIICVTQINVTSFTSISYYSNLRLISKMYLEQTLLFYFIVYLFSS